MWNVEKKFKKKDNYFKTSSAFIYFDTCYLCRLSILLAEITFCSSWCSPGWYSPTLKCSKKKKCSEHNDTNGLHWSLTSNRYQRIGGRQRLSQNTWFEFWFCNTAPSILWLYEGFHFTVMLISGFGGMGVYKPVCPVGKRGRCPYGKTCIWSMG